MNTSEAGFTKGPWELDDENAVCAGNVYIAAVKPVSHKILRSIDQETWNANASLIAAAPDLYDAADNALNALIGCCVPAGGVDDRKTILEAQAMLRAALAKAHGLKEA